MAEDRATVEDLEALIKGHKSMISYAKHLRDDDHYYTKTRERLLSHVEKLLDQLMSVDRVRRDADYIIQKEKDSIALLIRELALTKHRTKLERLMRMKEKIDALESEGV